MSTVLSFNPLHGNQIPGNFHRNSGNILYLVNYMRHHVHSGRTYRDYESNYPEYSICRVSGLVYSNDGIAMGYVLPFFKACEKGDVCEVRRIVSGLAKYKRTSYAESIAHLAGLSNSGFEKLTGHRLQMSDQHECISLLTDSGDSVAVYLAAAGGHLELLKLLGVITVTGRMLYAPCYYGCTSVVRWLIKHAIRKNGVSSLAGEALAEALSVAAMRGHFDIVRLLHAYGIKLTNISKCVLECSCKRNVSMLIKRIKPVAVLNVVIERGHDRIARFMIKHGIVVPDVSSLVHPLTSSKWNLACKLIMHMDDPLDGLRHIKIYWNQIDILTNIKLSRVLPEMISKIKERIYHNGNNSDIYRLKELLNEIFISAVCVYGNYGLMKHFVNSWAISDLSIGFDCALMNGHTRIVKYLVKRGVSRTAMYQYHRSIIANKRNLEAFVYVDKLLSGDALRPQLRDKAMESAILAKRLDIIYYLVDCGVKPKYPKYRYSNTKIPEIEMRRFYDTQIAILI